VGRGRTSPRISGKSFLRKLSNDFIVTGRYTKCHLIKSLVFRRGRPDKCIDCLKLKKSRAYKKFREEREARSLEERIQDLELIHFNNMCEP